METLYEAYRMAKDNNGAPGLDGVTFEAIELAGVEAFLEQIRDELVSRTYQPTGYRRQAIPKDDGRGERVLSIPAIRDRVVQGALKLILEPIFGATRPCGPTGIGGCDAFMKLCLSSSGCESRPAKGEPARVGSKPCASSRNGVGDA